VKNLDKQITESELDIFFRLYGTVLSSFISRDENDISCGYGYITFDNEKVVAEL
jgi:RNA recognition motif-containing protein